MKIFKSKTALYTLHSTRSIVLKETGVEYQKVKITNQEQTYREVLKYYDGDINVFESMFAMYLNRSNNTIGHVKISQGGVDCTVADIKLVTKYAIELLASSVILVHNHPSGNLNPSKNDDNLTKEIKTGLGYFKINLLDHLIITEDGCYSYASEGKL